MKVAVRLLWHIEVEDDIDLLNIDATTENVGGDHNSVLEGLEVSITLDALILLQVSVNCNRGEVVLAQQMIKHLSSVNALDEDNNLVEMQRVEQVNKLLDLFLLLDLDKVLLETVKSEFALVVNKDLEGVYHELATDVLNFLGHGSREHHHLLLGRSSLENGLHVSSHIYKIEFRTTYLNWRLINRKTPTFKKESLIGTI